MKRIFVSVFMAFVILLSVPAFAGSVGVVRGSYINVRKEAKFNSPIIGKKVRGDKYNARFVQHNWVKVEFIDGLKGWIYKTLVERAPAKETKDEKPVIVKKVEKTKDKNPKKKVRQKDKKKKKNTKKINPKKKKAKVVQISGNAEGIYNQAIKLYEKRRFSEALEKNKLALKKAPQNSEILNNIGNCLFKLKRVEEALASWKKALKIAPKSGKICNNIGIAYYQLDQNKKAIAYYKKAILFEPQFSDAYYNLASAYGFMGKFEESVANYKIFLTLTPETIMKKLAEERIVYCMDQIKLVQKNKK